MIEICGLSREFGDFVAVEEFNLKIERGSVFVLLGPNGSGKSTVVKMLTGMLAPTCGDAFIDGSSISNHPLTVKQKIGVLPENLALFESLSILEHLIMCGSIYGLSSDETLKRTEDILKYLDLWSDRNVFVERASYGMRKKCSLAMALIHNPKVLFLDEPFEGMDPISSRNIADLISRMSGKGVTIFLTSHMLHAVERLADRVAVIVRGKIVLERTASALRETYGSLEEFYFQHVGAQDVKEFAWIG